MEQPDFMLAGRLKTSSHDMDKPRILCLHGAGASARVFSLQMSGLRLYLQRSFRLVFVDGIYEREMHPDLMPVYAGLGPAYAWMRLVSDQHPPQDDVECSGFDSIRQHLMTAMKADEGKGEWVGLLGFSQGARLAFSILLDDQRQRDAGQSSPAFTQVYWKFGIIMACPAQPLTLTGKKAGRTLSRHCREGDGYARASSHPRLNTPTFHTCGRDDELLRDHRSLVDEWCGPGAATMREFEGGHRLPYRPDDVHAFAVSVTSLAGMKETSIEGR